LQRALIPCRMSCMMTWRSLHTKRPMGRCNRVRMPVTTGHLPKLAHIWLIPH